jgi:hypothetical protein
MCPDGPAEDLNGYFDAKGLPLQELVFEKRCFWRGLPGLERGGAWGLDLSGTTVRVEERGQ